MLIRTINDFVEVWKWESESTLKVLSALTDESLNQNGINFRTIGKLSNHIVDTLSEMPHAAGLREEGTIVNRANVKDIVNAYTKLSNELVNAVSAKWTDASLEEEQDMYGEKWKKAFTLQALLMHQIHHRGQLTVLMRIAGLKVPGMYGPSKEEWVAYGMEAPE